jgi:hypothetical protein
MMNSTSPVNRTLARCAASFASTCAAAFVCASMLAPAPANAAVTHVFIPAATEALDKGVPAGCAGAAEPPCLAGPLSEIESLDVIGGRVWVGDRPEGAGGQARIDQFEASSPWAFVGPQLDEEAGVTGIGARIAVGDVGVEGQVYTLAHKESKEVVAVYGGSSGKLLGSWTGSHTLTKSFTFQGAEHVAVLRDVAVDRSGNPLTAGDVYVETGGGSTPEFQVVDVFAPEPVGTIGEEPELLATLTGTCATPATSCPGEVIHFTEPERVAVSPTNGDVYVTDASGAKERPVVDVFRPGALHEYVFVGQVTGPPAGQLRQVAGVAADSGVGLGHGEVYVGDTSPGAERGGGVVYQFGEEGTFLGRLTGVSSSVPFNALAGVGVDAGSHDVFVAENDAEAAKGERAHLDVFGPDVVLPDPETAPGSATVDAEGHIAATLNGTVNPREAGEATCQFVWGTSPVFGNVAPCAGKVADGNSEVAVHVPIEDLAPDTTYSFRLQAGNANGLNAGEERQNQSFTTPGPGIHSVSSADVAATSATLDAQVDPNHASTSVFFQYTTAASTAGCGSGGGSCSLAPAAAGGEPLGAGSGDAAVREHIQGLAANTVYHYRLVAVSELEVKLGVEQQVVFFGADQAFQTESAANPGSDLLDERQWEQVSPVDKHGGVIYEPGAPASSVASSTGGRMSYPLTNPTEHGAAGFGESAQVLSTRGKDSGWVSQDIALAHANPIGKGLGGGLEYKGFSEDVCEGIVEPDGPFTSLTPEVFPPDSERTPYLRNDCTCPTEPTTCYAPIATGAEGYADVPPGTEFGNEVGEKAGGRIPVTGVVNFVGGSPDMKHVIVGSRVQLTGTATPSGVREVYEWSAEAPLQERLKLVSVDDENHPSPVGAGLGFEVLGVGEVGRGAVSVDGSRVFWTEGIGGGLFVRDVTTGVSLRLDVPHGGQGVGPVEPVFQGASGNGDRVFFTDQQRLTANSGAAMGKPDLYVCNITEEAGGLTCTLTDLTPANGAESGWLQGAIGLSTDGSWVYFVTNGVLPGTDSEGARPGSCTNTTSPVGATCNLYVAHDGPSGWAPSRLVSLLSGNDSHDWDAGEVRFGELTARVSPDGSHLVFMSDRSLTGYDNRDAVSGQSDEEVFSYHAGAEGPGQVVCVSCARSGARPEGVEYDKVSEGLVGGNRQLGSQGQWFAASVPGYEQYELTRALYQPRYLSDSGRVFFNAAGGLVPGDVNGNQDVYEWEPVGVGDCTGATSGFDSKTGGCLGLVSSGRAAGESAFVDASESGDDVFFLTGERLVRSDADTALDMYDAHACSSVAPCRPELQSSPDCVTADACRTASSPQPSVFGAPASATFSGQGNPSPSSVVKPRSVALTRAQLLAKALGTCRKDRKQAKRRACEQQARKKYGAKPKTKAKKTTRRLSK